MKTTIETHKSGNLKSMIEEALRALSARESKILILRFGLEDGKEHSLREIGKGLGLSAERVRQIQNLALRKLKHPAHSRRIQNVIASYQEAFEKENKEIEKIIEFPSSSNIVLITRNIDEKMIRFFSEHPEEMKTMDRRRFVELIAELFDGFGYEVEMTKQTRDGGRDIIAIKDSEVRVKYIIEAKRPNPENPVGVVPVRALYGAKCREKATKAILATTTYFTKDARLEFGGNLWELELRDYDGIIKWVDDYLRVQ